MKFTVLGVPIPKGRPKFGKGHAYTPERTIQYENLVKWSYRPKQFHEGAIAMDIVAYMPIPKATSKANLELMEKHIKLPTSRPDADNIIKGIADALNGIAYKDDSQIVDIRCRQYYSLTPRCEVEIWEV